MRTRAASQVVAPCDKRAVQSSPLQADVAHFGVEQAVHRLVVDHQAHWGERGEGKSSSLMIGKKGGQERVGSTPTREHANR